MAEPKKTLEEALADMEASNAKAAELRDNPPPELLAEIAKRKEFDARMAALPQAQRRQVLNAAGLHHVSAAPPPISPIRGSGYTRPSKPPELMVMGQHDVSRACVSLNQINLPTDATHVTVAEIPRLLAHAIHPSGNGKVTSYLRKQTPSNRMPEDLTDTDWELLHSIWHGLPTYKDGMTHEAWGRYADAFMDAKNKPSWMLVAVWLDKELNAQILQHDAETEHKKALSTAIARGEVVALNHARLPTFEYGGAILMVDALKAYALRFGVTVSVKDAQAQPSQATAKLEAEPMLASGGSGGVKAVKNHEPQTAPIFSMSKAALIAAHKHEWPSIEGDLKDASKNGLDAAKAGARDWHEEEALQWARSKNKLTQAGGAVLAMNLMSNLPRRIHSIGD